MDKSTRKKIQNIHQALSAAVSSINLAKRLLNELENLSLASPRDIPGEVGIFDGHFMVVDGGKKYQIPENYASKSKLVYGDQLKRLVQDGEERFKQIERVKRQDIEGILAKKDGQWHVIDSHGSYEVLSAAVAYFGVKEGDEVKAIIPQDNPRVPFAVLCGKVGAEEAKPVVQKEVVIPKQELKPKAPKVAKPMVKKEVGGEKPSRSRSVASKEKKPAKEVAKRVEKMSAPAADVATPEAAEELR